MTMIKKAVLAALAVSAAGTASAIDISTVPANNVLYASGSTAIGAALKAYFYNSVDPTTICSTSAGQIDVYAQASGTPKFTAVACNSNPALLSAGNDGVTSVPVALIKEDMAGSLNGVSALQNIAFSGSPYTDSGNLNFPDYTLMNTTNCGAGTVKSGTTSNNLQTYYNHTCTGFGSVARLPELGFSDVEGTLFASTDPTTPVALLSGPTVQVPFAPAVSLGLYRALQQVEGLTADDAVANMPNLTRAQLSTIFSGSQTSWSWLKNAAGTQNVGAQSVVWGYNAKAGCWSGTSTAATTSCSAALSASASANANVYICRRGANSGTQKSAEIFFNDYNCGNGVYPMRSITAPATTGCTTSTTDGCSWVQSSSAAKAVFAGNGTGDLLDCLTGHDAAGHFAIGFASVDNLSGAKQSTTNRQDFRYIKVDGEVPSIENAAAGRYGFVAQSFWYAPPSGASNDPATELKTVAAALLTVMTTNSTQSLGTVGSVAGVNAASDMAGSGLGYQNFHGGVLAIPGVNSAAPSAGSVAAIYSTNPVSGVTKTSSGGSTNNCIRPQYLGTASESTAGGKPTWAP